MQNTQRTHKNHNSIMPHLITGEMNWIEKEEEPDGDEDGDE